MYYVCMYVWQNTDPTITTTTTTTTIATTINNNDNNTDHDRITSTISCKAGREIRSCVLAVEVHCYIYIYIYIERERERERCVYT